MKIRAGALFGATSSTCRTRLDCTSSTAAISATPRPIAGVAVRAAERGPARLAIPIRAGPRSHGRTRAASIAAPRPSAHSRPNAPTTAATMTSAVVRVGAVATVMATSPTKAAAAPAVSRLRPSRGDASRRNRVAGEALRARASGASEKAAAVSPPKAAARSRGAG